jgi:polar amino acid transport system permease protein
VIDLELLSRYGPRMLDGLVVTLTIVALSIVIGAVLSAPLTAMRLSANPIINGVAYGYTTFFRGTPLIAQTFLVYYGAGQFRPFFQDIGLWWFFRDAFNCIVFTFALNTAAYQAEILRGAIRSVARGQWEAASALGVSRAVATWKVILPQAFIVALRPYGNEIILMIKGSAIASVVTIFDVMGVTRLAYARSFNFEVYIWAAVLYLAIVETLRRVWDVLERRLTRHLRPANA